ncbi:N-acetylmuramoyl-L-alanine amidase [Sneathiella chinensis]|uniref:N-acetylmuramoyl-L-alanine amidase n=1 Tax=Sneathiella chinensis TaxID=349750 RepID=A0ABQ5U3L7_9PROT|nr:N-acetylmuramoyl-L-alanine amidase [Sneathiella chinensis]GLQ05991.1 N-acetyl-anhydromuranmyl-L-alanine amidase [Sneathiella chinensis]
MIEWDSRFRSPNFNERRDGKIASMLVLHYTGMKTMDQALKRLCDPASEVSSHYLVDEAGHIYQLVPETFRAWHAGVGFWRGERDVNSASIGIEIVNPGHEFGYTPFPEQQMAAVERLAADVVDRHDIRPENVIGHSDLAPDRKQDPGELFDWKRLAAKGVGLWPDRKTGGLYPVLSPGDQGSHVATLSAALATIGYDLPKTDQYDESVRSVVIAFQRHWRPGDLSGIADNETQRLVYALRDHLT